MKGVPISPSEIAAKKVDVIPSFVFDVVNQLLIEKANGTERITLVQKDITARIEKAMPPGAVFNIGWLNFEDAYRQIGWTVKYDKPAYCERYDAFFEFSQQ